MEAHTDGRDRRAPTQVQIRRLLYFAHVLAVAAGGDGAGVFHFGSIILWVNIIFRDAKRPIVRDSAAAG